MIEKSDLITAIGGSLSGLLAFAMYKFYSTRNYAASEIKKLELVKIGPELKRRLESIDSHCLSYVAVEGRVTEQGKTFKTGKSHSEGVILQTSLVEHKSKRTNGVWADVKKVLIESLDSAPFALSDADHTGHLLMVTDATEADLLMDSLEVTHHEFIPRQSTVIEAGFDRIFGEVCRGIEQSEKMLVVGTSLLGIGEIVLEDERLKLRPPQQEGLKYYLTTLSKGQLVKLLQTQATIFKVISAIFGVVAVSMIGFVLWRVTKRYLEQRRSQQEIDEIREMRLRRHAQSRDCSHSLKEEEHCLVCFDNPREVITLNCGHISMCSDCAQALREPRCPVCREVIERFIPVYRP